MVICTNIFLHLAGCIWVHYFQASTDTMTECVHAERVRNICLVSSPYRTVMPLYTYFHIEILGFTMQISVVSQKKICCTFVDICSTYVDRIVAVTMKATFKYKNTVRKYVIRKLASLKFGHSVNNKNIGLVKLLVISLLVNFYLSLHICDCCYDCGLCL